MIQNKAAFLDRDGVINIDYGYVHLWENFIFHDGVISGLKNLIDLGFKIIIITNQSGIARGIFTEEQYEELTSSMLDFLKKSGIKITAIYHCPHHPDFSKNSNSKCNCRKPNPGLFLKAQKKFNISMKDSLAIGDNERDLVAAKLAGIEKMYFIGNISNKTINNDAIKSFKSLFDCSEFIKKNIDHSN